MDESSKVGRPTSQKTPEQVRAERIAAVPDPKMRQELDAMVKARDAQLVRDEARQKETFNSRVAELRNQKIRSANAPQLTPSEMRPSPYLGDAGHARAEIQAKAEVRTQNAAYLNKVAKDHNDQIDKRLDAPRENQIARVPSDRQAVESGRGAAPSSRAPNQYAKLIEAQNYAARAKQAELNREKEQDPARQQQKQRGLQR